MKKYIITIVDLRTGEHNIYTMDAENRIDVIIKYFKNINNIRFSVFDDIMTGFLRSELKSFSILCYTPNN